MTGLGPDPVLMGNVDPSNPLALGGPEEVTEEARRAIESAGTGGRLILGGGCMISAEVPPENMRALIRAAREAGPKDE